MQAFFKKALKVCLDLQAANVKLHTPEGMRGLMYFSRYFSLNLDFFVQKNIQISDNNVLFL